MLDNPFSLTESKVNARHTELLSALANKAAVEPMRELALIRSLRQGEPFTLTVVPGGAAIISTAQLSERCWEKTGAQYLELRGENLGGHRKLLGSILINNADEACWRLESGQHGKETSLFTAMQGLEGLV